MDYSLQDLKKLYETFNKISQEGEPCKYCGVYSTDKEHIVPLAYTNPYGEESPTVSACHECNLFASDKMFNSFEEKKDFIKKRIKTYYKKVLQSPDWTEHEIKELSGKLREYVFWSQRLKEVIKRRIRY